jgi:hypothetical protein
MIPLELPCMTGLIPIIWKMCNGYSILPAETVSGSLMGWDDVIVSIAAS